MINIEGIVNYVKDETRSFAERDKDGNKTDKMKDHRITEILLLVTLSDKSQRPCIVKGFDLPSTFTLPRMGDKWKVPHIRRYDATVESCPTIQM